MILSVLLRKMRSILFLSLRRIRSFGYRVLHVFWGTNMVLGNNVSFGKGVKIRTTDGGKITIGDNVAIDDYAVISAFYGRISIENNSYIGVGTHIVAIEDIVISDGALIAAYCIIRDMTHGMASDRPMYKQKSTSKPIFVGKDVWLGAHVVITAGSKINDGCVIGANGVVTSEIPQGVVAIGQPAKPVGERH